MPPRRRCFDPRPREGGDRPRHWMAQRGQQFRPTPPRRGRRQTDRRRALLPARFDPRPREGGDHRPARPAWPRSRFDPRPREGGDSSTSRARPFRRACFDPRPREGGDPRLFPRSPGPHGFDPRPREGGDALGSGFPWRSAPFRPTPPRRGRRPHRHRSQCWRGFRPTPPRRGRHLGQLFGDDDFRVSTHAPAKGATSRPG